MKAFAIFCALLCVPLHAQQQTASPTTQTWKSRQGTTLKATLRGVDAGNAIFDTGNGNIRQVPLGALTDEDQKRVAMMLPRLVSEALTNPASSPKLTDSLSTRVMVTTAAAGAYQTADVAAGKSYTSAHYEIHTEAALSPATALDLAQVLETAHEFMNQSPWGVLATAPSGGKFQVKLHEREVQIPANGGGGAGYDEEGRTLHVTLEAAGLKRVGADLVLDTACHPRALMRELAKMFMDDVDEAAPGWFIIGFPAYFERMPFRAGAFWTGMAERAIAEELARSGRKPVNPAGVLRMTHSEWNAQVPSSPSGAAAAVPVRTVVIPNSGSPIPLAPGSGRPASPVPPFVLKVPGARETAAHDAVLLCWYFASREPQRLGKFLKAVQKDKTAWDAYYTGAEQYRKDIAEFLKRPDVEKLPDGVFRYPASVTPPRAPKPPHDVESDAVPFIHQALLLDGRTEAQAAEEVTKALREAGIGG